ncbi:uncharacterized protein LOC132054309 [Lycium ferocissimum]|uniref:uncharacterized protein LOC132054309 n=1 Tax=Lycium ferocissimum TaxID=112874 RepID=UPI0028150C68|nr:uncharacterized protein LOC132054309 [Lycium ferocissimum]
MQTNATLDYSSPIYLSTSDVPGISPVPVPFAGNGFGGWKCNMIVSLSARNKIRHVDGSCPRPDEDSPQVRQWNRCNNLVISWLTSSLTPDIAESVQYSDTAESIWNQLCKRYGPPSGTKIFELKKVLASTSQGSLDSASYFNKLKKLWDEFRFMCTDHINTCTCAAKPGLQQEDEENKVYQFLMGLNKIYVGVRSNLLMMQPFPSLDAAYNIFLQDERQRLVNFPAQFSPDSASFNVNLNKIFPASTSHPIKT